MRSTGQSYISRVLQKSYWERATQTDRMLKLFVFGCHVHEVAHCRVLMLGETLHCMNTSEVPHILIEEYLLLIDHLERACCFNNPTMHSDLSPLCCPALRRLWKGFCTCKTVKGLVMEETFFPLATQVPHLGAPQG